MSEQDIPQMCRHFADQCDAHAAAVRDITARRGGPVDEPAGGTMRDALAGLRRGSTRPTRRGGLSGSLLLRRLSELFLDAQRVGAYWVVAVESA